ncbi:MAG: hypothetical protein ACK55Z_19205, partial [bacterium]
MLRPCEFVARLGYGEKRHGNSTSAKSDSYRFHGEAPGYRRNGYLWIRIYCSENRGRTNNGLTEYAKSAKLSQNFDPCK